MKKLLIFLTNISVFIVTHKEKADVNRVISKRRFHCQPLEKYKKDNADFICLYKQIVCLWMKCFKLPWMVLPNSFQTRKVSFCWRNWA